jgi:acetylornithine deacetylase/succinyl-diaminopimelate desuccinylase-like protein
MSRELAIARSQTYFDNGGLLAELSRRVACRSESQQPASSEPLHAYLDEELTPSLLALGFVYRKLANPIEGQPPFLLAERIEAGAAFTLLSYGHGDVVRGQDGQWRSGLQPWQVVVEGERWYGRGTADNKGQHSINLAALAQVLELRQGRLGYNVKFLFEMGEEAGSPGLAELVSEQREALAADLFIASDGPRVAAERPTLFLGSRGVYNFGLRLRPRSGAHHSGNWGGLLSNPGIRLAHAIASLVGAQGEIRVPGLLPRELPAAVRLALVDLCPGGDPGDPAIDPDWGQPGLSPAERVIGWNTLEVLALDCGNPAAPQHAIPGEALAHCHMRYVVGSDVANFEAHIRHHLDAHGYADVELLRSDVRMPATRTDPDDPWVGWCLDSMARSSDKRPMLLPNLGGSLPNDVFSETLGLPTLWLPHSYPGCAQHAPNEHLLAGTAREALTIMAGLFWDLAEQGPALHRTRQARQL